MSHPFTVQVPQPHGKTPRTNYISTTKYNVLTFLPLALLLQFKRYANIYFLVAATLQSIPLLSPLSPASAVIPLMFVLGISMIREGGEDYRRWKSDQKDNSQLTSIYTHEFQDCKWKDVKPGDFIRLQKDELVPADFLVLLASAPSGIAYVETSSLDGEKNLKPKFSEALFQKTFNQNKSFPNFTEFSGRIQCHEPSAMMQKFEGEVTLTLNSLKINQKVNKKNMMLRGCKLKNTDWVIGVVVYTGEDTGIMMNSCQPFTKTSNIEHQVNQLIIIIFALEVLCSFGSALFGLFECKSNTNFIEYITESSVDCGRQMGIAFGSYFILYSTFIPISLIVSLQIVKIYQGKLMAVDKEMYCPINDQKMICRTVSINEELGMIEYLLTDKTGTLTCNKMEFKNVVIGRDIYGEELKIRSFGVIDYQTLLRRNSLYRGSVEKNFDGRSLSYEMSLNSQQGSPDKVAKRQLIELMFTMIATCHECIPNSKGEFEGPSPDEVALLKAAYNMGFKFVSNENKLMTVQYEETTKTFELLKLIEFDSDRKCMTVVVKTGDSICVFTKGADTNIERILSEKQNYLEDIRQRTNQMTRTGLRSLWFAYKTYPLSIDVSQLSDSEIESQLTLVGATGIEDKLQDYVPETIYSLREGGIKVIMLTGDKLQTAENIAMSCKLIEEGYLIRGVPDLKNFIKYIDGCALSMTQPNASPVIDGSTLSFIENEADLSFVLEKAKSVVFCRVTPGQKAEIVKFVKDMGKLTLAVGDGANDVNMIMEANVGIGIFGEEGTRAAQVANYAIGQFCLLWKLLLHHGRLNYIRIAEMILYFFYKNMVFTSVQLVFCFYSMGSGQSFWLSWSITFYNMIFTTMPVILRAISEVDVRVSPSKSTFHELSKGVHEQQMFYSYYPKMYFISQQNKLFGKVIFFAWFLLGLFQGVICLVLTLYAIGDDNDSSGVDSYEIGFYLVEISVYTSVIIVVTLKLAVNVKQWTPLLVLGFAIPSIGTYFVYTFVQGFLQPQVTSRSISDLLSMPSFYVIQFLCVGGMFAFDFLLSSLKTTKETFENYLKYRTLKQRRLTEANLKKYMIEMYETRDQEISL